MTKLLIVGIGGFIGAVARYGLSGFVHRFFDRPFPLGTLTVNVLGCLVIGAVMTLAENRLLFSANTRVFITIGVLGSLTTFSTFGYETFELLRDNMFRLALLNVVANVLVGIVAVGLGRAVIKLISA